MRVWLLRGALLALALFVAVQLWFLGWIVFWKWHNPGSTAFIRHEQALGAQKGGTARPQQLAWVDYGRISSNLKRAVVASEDARFVHHAGVDWEAVGKAYAENARKGHAARGGSTISQQLAKNLFLSARRSYARKAEELLIAFMIEAIWDKRRILEVYLNVVEWGDGVFGAEAGARHYFGVPAGALDMDEATRMAAMLPSPKYFDHHRDGAYLSERAEAIGRYAPFAEIP